MSSSQNSIEALVGPPVVVIPFLGYADGTYNHETTASGIYSNGATASLVGAAANVSGYRGAIIQCVVSRPPGSNESAVKIIPHHGPCPEFITLDPFGADWGFFINGKSHASAGETVVKNVFVDTELSSSHLSVEVVLNSGGFVLMGVTVIPVLPKSSPKLDDFVAADLIKVFGSGVV